MSILGNILLTKSQDDGRGFPGLQLRIYLSKALAYIVSIPSRSDRSQVLLPYVPGQLAHVEPLLISDLREYYSPLKLPVKIEPNYSTALKV